MNTHWVSTSLCAEVLCLHLENQKRKNIQVSISCDGYVLGVDGNLPRDPLARSSRPDKSETCD